VLANVLEDISGKDYSEVKVSDLTGLSFDNVRLSSVLTSVGDDSTIAKVLSQATNTAWADIEVSQLSGSFDFTGVELETVMGGSLDVNMENILREAFGKPEGALTVGDLSGGFTLNNIKLKTLGIQAGDNKILQALFEDENVTVNGLGDSINNLKLYDVFGKDVFIEGTAPSGYRAYKKEGDTYTYVSDGVGATHYLNKNTGIWLLLCFETPEAEGRPSSYTIDKTLTFNSIGGEKVTESFTSAKIGKLVDAGLLSESTSSALYSVSLSTALNMIGGLG
jgi:hypothetical protein